MSQSQKIHFDKLITYKLCKDCSVQIDLDDKRMDGSCSNGFNCFHHKALISHNLESVKFFFWEKLRNYRYYKQNKQITVKSTNSAKNREKKFGQDPSMRLAPRLIWMETLFGK